MISVEGPTIAAGEFLSDVLDCSAYVPVRIRMPDNWNPANLTFQASDDNVTFSDLFDTTGNEFQVNVAASSVVRLSSGWAVAPVFIKFRSGTRAQPIVQQNICKFGCAMMEPATQSGPAGPQGPAGQDGAQGPPGPSGSQGLPGAQGPQGDLGSTGPAGPPGQTVTIVGSFSNKTHVDLPPDGYIPPNWDAPGSPPSAIQMANGQGLLYTPTQEIDLWVGPAITPSGWIILGNVQGPPGPQGPAGVVGPQGVQGPPGAEGAVGPQGPNGAVGPQGPIGNAGPKGDQGSQGPQGLGGPAGPQGSQGSQGLQGSVGPQGSQGNQGLQGQQGLPGPSAVSTNAGNVATLGTDNLILVSKDIKGTIAADNAPAGCVGEFLSASNSAGISLTSGTASNIATLALPAGDWQVWGIGMFSPSGAPTSISIAISSVSATLPTPAQIAAGSGAMTQLRMNFANGQMQTMQTGFCRINTSAPANVFLAGQSVFGGTCSASGFISARRVR